MRLVEERVPNVRPAAALFMAFFAMLMATALEILEGALQAVRNPMGKQFNVLGAIDDEGRNERVAVQAHLGESLEVFCRGHHSKKDAIASDEPQLKDVLCPRTCQERIELGP